LIEEEYHKSESGSTGGVCELCYEGELHGGLNAFKFDCGHHLYCNDCVKESFTDYINRSEMSKLVCFTVKCGTKVRQEQVEELFVGDKEMVQKFIKFTNKDKLESYPLVRYCPKKDCGGIVRGKTL